MTICCQHFLKTTMPSLGIQKNISELSMNKTKDCKWPALCPILVVWTTPLHFLPPPPTAHTITMRSTWMWVWVSQGKNIIVSDNSVEECLLKIWTTACTLDISHVQPWWPIRITQKAVKNLDAKTAAHTIKGESLRVGSSQPSVYTLPRWFQCAAKFGESGLYTIACNPVEHYPLGFSYWSNLGLYNGQRSDNVDLIKVRCKLTLIRYKFVAGLILS